MENLEFLPVEKVIIHGLAFYWVNYALGYIKKETNSSSTGAIFLILNGTLAYFTTHFVIELFQDILKELRYLFGNNTTRKPSIPPSEVEISFSEQSSMGSN